MELGVAGPGLDNAFSGLDVGLGCSGYHRGPALGPLPNNSEISRALLIAAQAGYWKLMPERYPVYAMLNFISLPSRGNPRLNAWRYGLLRCARNDGGFGAVR